MPRQRSPIRRRRLSGGRARLVKGKCPTSKRADKKYVRRTVCASKIADATTLHGRYRQVFSGKADRTKSGLKKSDLKRNRRGVIVSKKKQQLGKEAEQSEAFQANKIRRQTVSIIQLEQLALMTTKKGGIKYKYWTDDDGDKFKIVSISNKEVIIQFKKDGEYEEEKTFEDEGYEDHRKFTAAIMDSDMEKLIPDDEYEPQILDGILSGGRRIRGGKYKKLADVTCGEKRGYPTRRTTMCVLVNKRRKSRKSPCKDGKIRRRGGRCAPGAKTPCKKEGQVRRKNSKGKYECRKKSSRKKKTIKKRREECREKGKVYNRESGRCRDKKKPKKKSSKKKKSIKQRREECREKGKVYDRKSKRCRNKKKSSKKKKKSKK